jgi:hypothetical protein
LLINNEFDKGTKAFNKILLFRQNQSFLMSGIRNEWWWFATTTNGGGSWPLMTTLHSQNFTRSLGVSNS